MRERHYIFSNHLALMRRGMIDERDYSALEKRCAALFPPPDPYKSLA
jgi:hypothetical protein